MFILRYKDGDYFKLLGTISANPNRFPDETLSLGKVPKGFNEILWLYDGDDEFFTLMCLRQHSYQKDIKLILPYIPHARMDRTKDGEVFTLKTFCTAINGMNFSQVVVADPHSHVSEALFDRVKILSPKPYIAEAIKDIGKHSSMVLFFPDEGAMKRYSNMFPFMPYSFGLKDRDWATGKINGLKLINKELVKDKPVLIVDDICSRGGTFYHSSHALHEAGAKEIYLYVTHCEDTIYDGEMYKENLIKQIYVTDSKLYNCGDSKIKTIYSFMEAFESGEVF